MKKYHPGYWVVGDLVLCRNVLIGTIIEIDKEDFERDNVVWALIYWSDGRYTWEDLVCSSEDKIFKKINAKHSKA